MQNTEPEIIFDEEPHTYYLGGVIIPSVSAIVADVCRIDFSSVPAEIMERAIRFGNFTHKATELIDKHTLDFNSIDEALVHVCSEYMRFKEDFGIEIIKNEYVVYSKNYNYAGRLDRVVLFNKGRFAGKLSNLDIKTKSHVGPESHLQVDGYSSAWNENNPNDKCKSKFILQLLPDKPYKLIDSNDPKHMGQFVMAARTYNWKKAVGIIK